MEERITLAKYRLEKSADQLKSAEILYNSGQYSDSMGRSYYSMFSAAKALLALKGVDRNRHASVVNAFNVHFVKTGIVDRTIGRRLSAARLLREASDYQDFYKVSKDEALAQLESAKIFINIALEIYENISTNN
jgi:uncharacterized protein (UPF0332 family)